MQNCLSWGVPISKSQNRNFYISIGSTCCGSKPLGVAFHTQFMKSMSYFFGKTMMFIPTSNRFLRAKIAVANRLFSMKAKAKPNKMLAQPRSISLNQGRRGVWNLSNTISTPCFSWRHPNKKNINPKDHWTLQWKGLNLYGRVGSSKIASFEGSGYLGK